MTLDDTLSVENIIAAHVGSQQAPVVLEHLSENGYTICGPDCGCPCAAALRSLPPATCYRTHTQPDEHLGVTGAVWIADVLRVAPSPTCPTCGGNGWYATGPTDAPEQVQCEDCAVAPGNAALDAVERVRVAPSPERLLIGDLDPASDHAGEVAAAAYEADEETVAPSPDDTLTGRDIHREWRDGMLAQGREVAPERMAWETLDERDRELDDAIAARLTAAALRVAPSPDALDVALRFIRGIASGEGGDEASRTDPWNALATIVIACDEAAASVPVAPAPETPA